MRVWRIQCGSRLIGDYSTYRDALKTFEDCFVHDPDCSIIEVDDAENENEE